jgi:hypothetical protein
MAVISRSRSAPTASPRLSAMRAKASWISGLNGLTQLASWNAFSASSCFPR